MQDAAVCFGVSLESFRLRAGSGASAGVGACLL